MTTSRFTIPALLPALAERYSDSAPSAVRFRMPSWKAALVEVPGEPTRLLSDPSVTTDSTTQSHRAVGDRVVTRDAVINACSAMDLTDDNAVIAAFVLVMAWGSGTSNSRSLRNTRKALVDVRAAASALRESAEALRAVEQITDPVIADMHRQFVLPGIGEAFYTKWFAFAGYAPGRQWQPLILDSRVRRTLHHTLDTWLNQLTDVHRHPERYIAYLTAMHQWAAKLPQPITASQLEWIIFTHNGRPI
ncbi:8-oxoguanine DNA glycosylase OGG fold protein [Mycobacteroides abscessus]|uniref:8-oxoguanine DNA glycosylase OGG fold protein n=1 Tax=Mycobacteroides abscessus TaxID=36809 RepID=UPI00355B147E